jgi:hypothetical protein
MYCCRTRARTPNARLRSRWHVEWFRHCPTRSDQAPLRRSLIEVVCATGPGSGGGGAMTFSTSTVTLVCERFPALPRHGRDRMRTVRNCRAVPGCRIRRREDLSAERCAVHLEPHAGDGDKQRGNVSRFDPRTSGCIGHQYSGDDDWRGARAVGSTERDRCSRCSDDARKHARQKPCRAWLWADATNGG